MATALVFITLFFFSASLALSLSPSNASLLADSPSPQSPLFLQGVVKAIAARERWEGDVRVSDLDAGSVKVGGSQRYEFHVRVDRTVLLVKLSDEVVSWRTVGGGGAVDFSPDLLARAGLEGFIKDEEEKNATAVA